MHRPTASFLIVLLCVFAVAYRAFGQKHVHVVITGNTVIMLGAPHSALRIPQSGGTP